jgi:rubrerythrin
MFFWRIGRSRFSRRCQASGQNSHEVAEVFSIAGISRQWKTFFTPCPLRLCGEKTLPTGACHVEGTEAGSVLVFGERKDKKMSKTEEFLKAAFAGESQTNRRYLAFAAKADKEGFFQAAQLFRATAEAETVHAHNYLKALQGVRGTRENLLEAISVESRAFTSLIPEMVDTARVEGNKEAEDFFRYAMESERIHAQLFQKLADALGSSGESYFYYVCPVCGHTAEKTPPSTCPICGIKDPGYKKIE